MALSTHHLITFCLAAVVIVAVALVFHERRRQQGLSELLRRLVHRKGRRNADEFPF